MKQAISNGRICAIQIKLVAHTVTTGASCKAHLASSISAHYEFIPARGPAAL